MDLDSSNFEYCAYDDFVVAKLRGDKWINTTHQEEVMQLGGVLTSHNETPKTFNTYEHFLQYTLRTTL